MTLFFFSLFFFESTFGVPLCALLRLLHRFFLVDYSSVFFFFHLASTFAHQTLSLSLSLLSSRLPYRFTGIRILWLPAKLPLNNCEVLLRLFFCCCRCYLHLHVCVCVWAALSGVSLISSVLFILLFSSSTSLRLRETVLGAPKRVRRGIAGTCSHQRCPALSPLLFVSFSFSLILLLLSTTGIEARKENKNKNNPRQNPNLLATGTVSTVTIAAGESEPLWSQRTETNDKDENMYAFAAPKKNTCHGA